MSISDFHVVDTLFPNDFVLAEYGFVIDRYSRRNVFRSTRKEKVWVAIHMHSSVVIIDLTEGSYKLRANYIKAEVLSTGVFPEVDRKGVSEDLLPEVDFYLSKRYVNRGLSPEGLAKLYQVDHLPFKRAVVTRLLTTPINHESYPFVALVNHPEVVKQCAIFLVNILRRKPSSALVASAEANELVEAANPKRRPVGRPPSPVSPARPPSPASPTRPESPVSPARSPSRGPEGRSTEGRPARSPSRGPREGGRNLPRGESPRRAQSVVRQRSPSRHTEPPSNRAPPPGWFIDSVPKPALQSLINCLSLPALQKAP